MSNSEIQYIIQTLLKAGIPTILFLVFCQYYFYRNVSLKEKIKGLLCNFCVSFFSISIANHYIKNIILSIVERNIGVTDVSEIVVSFVVMIGVFCAYATIFLFQLQGISHEGGLTNSSIYVGLFVFSEYNLILFTAYAYAKSDFEFNVTFFVLSAIWLLLFYTDLPELKEIYSRRFFSIENGCMFLQLIVVGLFSFFPMTSDYVKIEKLGTLFNIWLDMSSLFLFVFCMCVFKMLIMQAHYANRAKQIIYFDELTRLQNRRSFMEKGLEYIRTNAGDTVAIIYINILHFKSINQNYGKETGDKILRDMGQVLVKTFSDAILISRISDDHFAILTNNMHNIELNTIKTRKEVASVNDVSQLQMNVGVYVIKNTEEDINAALDNAMIACRTAGSNNTVSIQFFDDKIFEEKHLNQYVLDNIDKAVKDEKLKIYYQPIVDLKTGMYMCAEALIRWNDSEMGFLSPGKFVPVLEKNNMIYKVDCFVIEQVCKDQRRLLDNNIPVITTSFNISRKDFFVLDMVDYVEKMVHKYNIPKHLLKVEITESAFCEDGDYIITQLERFKELGYKVWMDDFGAGYSSLNLMGTFSFDGIKLDMVFLKNISPVKKELMRGIVHTAKLLGVEVLAEGVETKEQYDLVCDIDCDLGQGYRFSMPMSLEEHLKTSGKKVFNEAK